MAIGNAVEIRYEIIAALPHVPGHCGVARFVDGEERTAGEAENDQKRPQRDN